jgi:hypothetical protein
MNFIDGSASTEKDLVVLKKHPGYEIIYVGIRGEDGAGLEAGNLGLSTYEVAIGFSEGSSQSGTQQFADVVVHSLERTWRVHEVPPGQGAFPLGNCSSESK